MKEPTESQLRDIIRDMLSEDYRRNQYGDPMAILPMDVNRIVGELKRAGPGQLRRIVKAARE